MPSFSILSSSSLLINSLYLSYILEICSDVTSATYFLNSPYPLPSNIFSNSGIETSVKEVAILSK